jgi:hypothetical protein
VDLSTGTLHAIERHFEGKPVVIGGTAWDQHGPDDAVH